jgi:hypothetical protein
VLTSSLDFTQFEASTRGRSGRAVRALLAVEPFGEQTVQFRFDVPPFVHGATFCTRMFVGLDPNPLVSPVRESFLFCFTGHATGFEVMSESEDQKIFETLSEKSRSLRDMSARSGKPRVPGGNR